MTRTLRLALAAASTLCLLTVSPSSADVPRDTSGGWGEGASSHCLWMILDAVDHVGETCFPGRDAAFKAAARNGVTDLESFIAAHSKRTPSSSSALRDARLQMRRQTEAGLAAGGGICRGDAAMLYEMMRQLGPEKLRQGVTAKVSRPTEVDAGDCF